MESRILANLEQSLPDCTFIYGVGTDFTLPRYIAKHYKVSQVDYFERDKLLVKDVKTIKRVCSVPSYGNFKLIVVRLDGASDAALNDMLILLECPPRHTKFIFFSRNRTLRTIESRCIVYEMGSQPEDTSHSPEKELARNVLTALRSGKKDVYDEAVKAMDREVARELLLLLNDEALTNKSAQQILIALNQFNPYTMLSALKAVLANYVGRI